MRQEDLSVIAQLLTTYWQGQEPNDLATFSACYQLADLVLNEVPRAATKRIQKAPTAHREMIIVALKQLLEREPAARSLAESLLGNDTTSPRPSLGSHPNVSIHGSNNQISVGPHLGPVTQIMQPPGDQRQVVRPPDGIDQQHQLLEIYRGTLAHFLTQRARLGVAYEPPGVAHGIAEARAGIVRCKAILRSWGVSVPDHPEDMDASFHADI